MRVPDPMEWHPAYSGRTDLLDWLHCFGPYAKRSAMLVPFPKPLRWSPEVETSDKVMATAVLDRRECFGRAPYVGHPFTYLWRAGVDQFGRCITTDSWRVYDQSWPCRDADCSCGQAVDQQAAVRATDEELAKLLRAPEWP